MKKKIFVTGSAGFIGFSLAKFLLDDGHTVHGYDCISDYYDVRLKHARNKILKSYKNFSSTEEIVLSDLISDPDIIQGGKCLSTELDFLDEDIEETIEETIDSFCGGINEIQCLNLLS